MFKRKKGFTAAGTKLTSYRMRSAMLGSHVERQRKTRRGHMNADAVGFSSSRKRRRAARGLVDHVTPSTSSAESRRDYSRRVGRKPQPQAIQRKAHSRRIASIVICALAALVLAAGVGSFVFIESANGKLSLGSSDAPSALAAQPEGAPYYVLCVADLRESQTQLSQTATRDVAYELVRVDEDARVVTAIEIPANLQIKLSDGAYHSLCDTRSFGDGELVRAVSDFAGVDISHIVKTDASGIEALVTAAGGVSVSLAEEVDDPIAGDAYLPQGENTLDGSRALTLLRAANYSGGSSSQAANRTAFFCALARSLMQPSGFPLARQVERLAEYAQTDWDLFGVMSVSGALCDKAGDANTTYYTACVPEGASSAAGGSTFTVASDKWSEVMALVDQGGDPALAQETVPSVDPASFTVAVRNGTDVVGSAAQTARILSDAGFAVGEVGNVDDYTIYPETLIVYKEESFKECAQAVAAALGAGRVINGGSYYSFSDNVLVVIGQDYQPIM